MKKIGEKGKLSLSINKEFLKVIKKRAIDEDKTISRLVEELLEKSVEGDYDNKDGKS